MECSGILGKLRLSCGFSRTGVLHSVLADLLHSRSIGKRGSLRAAECKRIYLRLSRHFLKSSVRWPPSWALANRYGSQGLTKCITSSSRPKLPGRICYLAEPARYSPASALSPRTSAHYSPLGAPEQVCPPERMVTFWDLKVVQRIWQSLLSHPFSRRAAN